VQLLQLGLAETVTLGQSQLQQLHRSIGARLSQQ